MASGYRGSNTPNPEAIVPDQNQYDTVRERLVKAYAKKAQWENRIVQHRREIETIVNRINGHFSSDQTLDFEQFLPAEAQLTSPRRTTGRESIKQISALQGSLDAAKVRINALLNENQKLRSKFCERSRDLNSQVSRIDMIIEDLLQIQKKEREYAALDEIQSALEGSNGQWQNHRVIAQEATEQESNKRDAADVDIVMREESERPHSPAEEAKSPEVEAAQCPTENNSQRTETPPPSAALQSYASVEEREGSPQ